MITPNHTQLFNQLDKSKLDKVQIVRTPTATVCIDGDIKTKFGGYKAIVHYNRDKEIAHSTQKIQKRFRNLRKQEKHAHCCTIGDTFPNVSRLNKAGESNR